MGFVKDLKAGEDIEKEILAILLKKFPNAYKETGKFHREFYDIIIPKEGSKIALRLEIKADLYKSKNLAFECLGREAKSTGILKTSSVFWIHFRNDKYLIWDRKKLKRYLLKKAGEFIRDCGDDHASAAYIIPEEFMFKVCPPDAIIDRNSDKLNDFFLERLN